MLEREESVLDDILFHYFPVSVWEGICPNDIFVLSKMGLNEVFLDFLLLIGFPWIDVIIVKIIGFIGEPCQHGTLLSRNSRDLDRVGSTSLFPRVLNWTDVTVINTILFLVLFSVPFPLLHCCISNCRVSNSWAKVFHLSVMLLGSSSSHGSRPFRPFPSFPAASLESWKWQQARNTIG